MGARPAFVLPERAPQTEFRTPAPLAGGLRALSEDSTKSS